MTHDEAQGLGLKFCVEGFGSASKGYDWFIRGQMRSSKKKAADDLRELKAKLKEAEALRKQRDVLLVTLRKIASIAHCGGLSDMTESDALIAIRGATIPHFVTEASEEQHIAIIADAEGDAA